VSSGAFLLAYALWGEEHRQPAVEAHAVDRSGDVVESAVGDAR